MIPYHYFFFLSARATAPMTITAATTPTAIYKVSLLEDGVVGVFTFVNATLMLWLCPLTETDPVKLLYPLDVAV